MRQTTRMWIFVAAAICLLVGGMAAGAGAAMAAERLLGPDTAAGSELPEVAALRAELEQDPTGQGRWGSGDRMTFRCESNDGRRNYCAAELNYRVDVRLSRQISNSPCREGETWGWDRRGVWVDRGCRAEFEIVRRGGGWNDDYILCESNDGRRNTCNVRLTGRDEIRMARQVSNAPCRQNSTWGSDRNGIWVDRGCRAEFEVVRRGGGGGGGGRDDDTIRCESNDGRRNYCNARLDGNDVVRLARQLSSATCRQNSTWGFERNRIWVDRGCRGEFEIVRRGGGRGRDGDRDGRGGRDDDTIRCESSDGRRNVCAVGGNVRNVTLSRQLSSATCRQNSTWGWDGRGVWVDRGCRAEFLIIRGR